jgi:DNA primase
LNRVEAKSLIEFTHLVLRRLFLAEVVFAYINPTALKSYRIMALCSFHDEKTPSLAVYENKSPERAHGIGMFHCYSCGITGTAIDFIENMENLSTMDALRLTAAKTELKIPPEVAQGFEKILQREKDYGFSSIMDELERQL